MWKKRFSKLHEKDFRKVNTIIQKSNSDFTGIKNCPVKTSYLYTSFIIQWSKFVQAIGKIYRFGRSLSRLKIFIPRWDALYLFHLGIIRNLTFRLFNLASYRKQTNSFEAKYQWINLRIISLARIDQCPRPPPIVHHVSL